MVSGCGAPVFRSHEDRFAPAPELIEQVEPYLERWATTPPEQTRAERREVASRIDGILSINPELHIMTDTGETIYILVIRLDAWGDWERGYFYVHDGSRLPQFSKTRTQRVNEHFYIYNRNIG